jgi:predicted ABC-type transport system involved in lysophospholipase L1 biosynthesis ATPase subunit
MLIEIKNLSIVRDCIAVSRVLSFKLNTRSLSLQTRAIRGPTGNLDKKNTQNVFDIFKELTQTYHQTIIAVTHDQDFAHNSDRIIEMSDGVIVKR